MARASTTTLLALDRWSRIIGIAPPHFNQAATPSLDPVIFPTAGCSKIWFQHDWQSYDQVSREGLAETIRQAEDEIMSIIGYPMAPLFIEEEAHSYPRPFERQHYGSGIDIRGQFKTIKARYGKFRGAGTRQLDAVGGGTASVAGLSLVYTDSEVDGLYETATITLPTTLTDACEIKVYFENEGQDPDWEIRPPRSITVDGVNVVIVFDAWLFIDPALWDAYPTDAGPAAIDISNTVANYVDSVDVYREYVDDTETSAQFFWELGFPSPTNVLVCPTCGTSGCVTCAYATQNGCLNARDPEHGILVPVPATYDSDNGVWDRAVWSECREPDLVKLWYRAGEQSQKFVQGRICDPLSNFWATTITWLAAARLDKPVCGCSNVEGMIDSLQIDLIHNTRESSFFVTDDIMTCPFGTRKGEVMAWRRIKRLVKDRTFEVALI